MGLAAAVLTATAAPGAAAPTAPDVWASSTAGGGNASANLGETAISTATVGGLAPAWSRPAAYAGFSAVTIVDGVAYTTRAKGNASEHWQLVALDVRSGAVRWQTTLPLGGYFRGVSVVGDTAVLAADGLKGPGGIVAVSLTSHQVVWHHDLGTDDQGQPYTAVQPVVVDAGRAYMAGGDGLTAYRLDTGRPLWTHVYRYPHTLTGYAAVGGRVFVGGEGVIAFDGATGHQLWQGVDGIAQPVAADGRVFVPTSDGVAAYDQEGCGTSLCQPRWSAQLTQDVFPYGVSLGGAGDGTLYAAFTAPGSSPRRGRLVRLAESTGQVQWTAPVAGAGGIGVLRAGDLVWTTAHGESTVPTRLVAYTARGSSTAPVASLREPGLGAYPQGTAVADGTLVLAQLGSGLSAYRVPGSAPTP